MDRIMTPEECKAAAARLEGLRRGMFEEERARLEESCDLFRWYDRENLRWVVVPKGLHEDWVAVTCYGERERWYSRENALVFYHDASLSCEGCERERYENVFFDLYDGRREAFDTLAAW